MIGIKVAHGTYLIDSWNDILSLRVEVVKGNEAWMWRRLERGRGRLQFMGKLDGMAWLRDIEEEIDGLVSITRQWSRTDATRFIPDKEK